MMAAPWGPRLLLAVQTDPSNYTCVLCTCRSHIPYGLKHIHVVTPVPLAWNLGKVVRVFSTPDASSNTQRLTFCMGPLQ